MKRIDYTTYITSKSWLEKRIARLELDGHKCRLCDSIEKLEVHHRPSSYEKIPNESVENDLVTVCVRCHDLITNAIRGDRYSHKKLSEPVMKSKTQNRSVNYGMANTKVQTNERSTIDYAQRVDGRSRK